MIHKIKPTAWRSGHAHRDPGQKFFKSRAWWPVAKTHGRYSEHSDGEIVSSRYPEAILEAFEDAVRRCPLISIHSDIMEGQPCIAGTRIPVKAVLRALEQYGSVGEVRRCYPHLTTEQVEEALYFSQVLLELPSGLDETAAPVG